MKKLTLACFLIFITITGLFSQDGSVKPPENRKWFLHLETGYINPVGTIKENISIRQNISSYYVNQSSNGNISSTMEGVNLGLRWEYFNTRFKTGISSGLRYYRYNTEITGYSSSNADFFYLRYSMLNSDTKFARVKSILESNNFLTVPLEIRIVPFDKMGFALFIKAGAEFLRINLKNNNTIKFQDDNMKINEDAVLTSIGTSDYKHYATIYGSAGMKIGRENNTNYIFELLLPSAYLTDNNFTLMDMQYFHGVRFSVQFPVR